MKALKLFLLMSLTVLLSACADNSEPLPEQNEELLKPFIKEWYCDEHTVEDEESHTGYLALYVLEDGTMSMYDTSGNPGIEGEFIVADEDTVIYNCTNEVDFDPPFEWGEMKKQQELSYRFEKEGEILYLSFEGKDGPATLKFFADDAE